MPERPCDDPVDRIEDSLDTLIPPSAATPYDMHELIRKVADEGDFFELQPAHAANIIVGFCRIEGRTVGVVANQPMVLAGVLDINSSKKAARFVRFCDAFDIPILTFVDVPGFLPGVGAGASRHHQARRQIAVRLRRGDGAQDHRDHAQGLWRRLRRHGQQASARRLELRLADRRDRGDGRQGRGRDHLPRQDGATRSPSAPREYEERFANPFVAASKGFIDEVIMPHSTRRRVAMGLRKLRNKQLENPWKKHDNIPL